MDSETKNQKFQRLAEKRTNDVIKKLRLIGNLANTRQYDYSNKEVEEMFSAISEALRRAKSSYKSSVVKNNDTFSFKD